MPRKKSDNKPQTESVVSYKSPAKRKNIPLAGLEAHGKLQDAPKIRYEYNPHLPPILRSATDAKEADNLPELLRHARQRPLSADEAKQLAEALRRHEPWLEWSGKREKPWFEVEPVVLHMHERVSTQAILKVLAREDVQRDMFADPQQSYAQAVQFYQHEVDWSNRMILGDSLQVMASLARREDLAGRVQMLYMDPPYGIKFKSNFMPDLKTKEPKDREQDLTREPETVRAYRDTWTLGTHSYLTYLRDRLAMAKELLADTGSIFVQISDENLHRVRCLLDEIFQRENFVSLISYKTTQAAGSKTLDTSCDYLLWYAKDIEKAKCRQLFKELTRGEKGATRYDFMENLHTGETRRLNEDEQESEAPPEGWRWFTDQGLTSRGEGSESTMGKIEFQGESYFPTVGHWRTRNENVQNRLIPTGRVLKAGKTIRFKKCFEDFGCLELTNLWDDVGGGITSRDDPKIYPVQTSTTIVQRCVLMTTDPGDLVLDPTCGSGTTAYVAEQWGRRWITCDTSRVALALARQRLMTTRFPFYQLRELAPEDLNRSKDGTWIAEVDKDGKTTGKRLTLSCKQVPHIELRTIALNTSLDPIIAKHEPLLATALRDLTQALKSVTSELRQKLSGKLIEKQKRDGKKSITEADRRRWELPKSEWKVWEVPFDTDPDWPKPLQAALTAYRTAWRAKMDDVNACIAANAEMEELVDKPEIVSGTVRVAGPFTMEGVIALEDGPDTPIGGAPEGLETFGGDAADLAVTNAEAHLDKILRLLKASGVDFPGNKNMKFSRLDPMTGVSLIHAEGEWMNGDQKERRVAVSVGPEVGNLSLMQVEDAIRSANRKGYDELVFAAFGFDANAQDVIESESHPKLRLHMALIRPDVAMGDLLKTQPGSQLFSVFSAPRVKTPEKQKDGQFIVEVEGMDVYDPVSNAVFPSEKTGNDCIAAWFLDSDYDGRTFCICQAFFPDKSKWDKLAKALGDKGVIEEEAFAALTGFKSLPFPRPARLNKGEKWQIAVKVLDPRGNEGMRVLQIA
jgi:adenine-specific DNA-methyltransferase